MENLTKVAFMYDFDKTLCDRDMQEYKFIPDMGLTPAEFWGGTGKLMANKDNSIEKVLSYMYLMIKTAKEKGVKLTREYLNSCGANINYFNGVKDWFVRINKMAANLGLEVEHYIISSGLKEILDGCEIRKFFKEVFSCEFHYDENGNADFPALQVNYTMKTQFLHRISKGVLDYNDDVSLNDKIPDSERRIKMRNMVYFGDGLTDVPCMRLTKANGGFSIAVYNNDDRTAKKLLKDERCNFIAKADYSEGSELDGIIKRILCKISNEDDLEAVANSQKRGI